MLRMGRVLTPSPPSRQWDRGRSFVDRRPINVVPTPTLMSKFHTFLPPPTRPQQNYQWLQQDVNSAVRHPQVSRTHSLKPVLPTWAKQNTGPQNIFRNRRSVLLVLQPIPESCLFLMWYTDYRLGTITSHPKYFFLLSVREHLLGTVKEYDAS